MEDTLNPAPKTLSRRQLLQYGSAFAASFAAAQGLTACSPQELSETGGDTESATGVVSNVAALTGGEWKPLPCGTGCCNNCTNFGYVVDGKVVAQRTDDVREDSFDRPQVRSCVKGHALRYKMQGEDRLNYPMKRKNWEPGGTNVNGELRGVDEWERISWDDALDMIASEIKRIKEAYGNQAFLAPSTVDERGGVLAGYVLNAYGGCTNCWGSSSAGTWPLAANLMQGQYNLDNNDKYSLRHSKLIVLWGYNPVWTWPKVAYELSEAKKAGAEIIMVDPWYSPSAQALADQWIPCRPGTDGALLLAIAHYMIENDLQDQDFLDTYTVGFDAAHMPADAPDAEPFRDYVLGVNDGTPKTPEWASVICGVPAATIEEFAHKMATVKPAAIRASMAPARSDNGFSFARLFMAVGWMTGNKGSEGAEVSAGTYVFGGYTALGAHGMDVPANPLCTPPLSGTLLWTGAYDPDQYYGIAFGEVWNAVVTGKYNGLGNGQQDIDIRCIYGIGYGAPLNNLPNVNKGIEAFRKVEFVVTSDIFMTTDCCYSDIVLPAASTWERPWGSVMRTTNVSSDADGDALSIGAQICDAPFERRTDLWMEVEIGKRLGIDESTLQSISWDQANFNHLAAGITTDPTTGEVSPLLTITQEDIDELGVEGTPQEGLMPLAEFLEHGTHRIERSEDCAIRQIGHAAFVADPQANPLPTASGKLEICCKSLSDALAVYHTEEFDPTPRYTPSARGFEASFTDWDEGERGEFDLQLLTVHYIAHQLSQSANVRELNEYWPNSLLMNSADAAARQLKTGDTVLVTSECGQVLRRVAPTPTLMPGVVILGEGNWVDLDEDGIDRGGNGNVLCSDRLCGFGQVPWNSNLVKVEAWTGEALEEEYQRPRRILEA